MSEPNTSKSVDKAIDLLELFFAHDELTLSELSELSGIQRSIVSRLVATLVNRGYLFQREKRGKYSLGTTYLNYSGLVKRRFRLRSVGMPFFIGLTRQLHETISVGYVTDPNRLSLVAIESFHDTSQGSLTYSATSPEAAGLPMHASAIGKAILAKLPEESFERFLAEATLDAYSSRTITDKSVLRDEISKTRAEGIAYDDEEYMEGLRAVAAGVEDNHGVVQGAIGVIGPAFMYPDSRMDEIAPAIKNCAQIVSLELTSTNQRIPREAASAGFSLRELRPLK